VIKKLIESNIAGDAFITASVDRDSRAELTAAGIGVVFSDLGPAGTVISNVSVKYERGISQGVDYAAELGDRRAAIIQVQSLTAPQTRFGKRWRPH
jgi:DNA-binding LacI/PurR family transcriptional regulator